jgi:hypothetical protein
MAVGSNSVRRRLHLGREATTWASGDTWVVDGLLKSVALGVEVVIGI